MTNSFDKERAHDTFYKMIRADRLHRCTCENFLKNLGLHRSQHMLLMHLSKSDGCNSQKELAEHFKISPAAIAVTLKKLEDANLLERKSDKDDSRYNSIVITEKGKDLIKRSKNFFEETDYAMFSDFSEEEYSVFEKCIEKMMNGLKNYSEKNGLISKEQS